MLIIPNEDGSDPAETPGEETPAPTAGNEDESSQGAGSEQESEPEPEQAPDPQVERIAQLEAQAAEERENRIRMEERLKVREEQPPLKEEPPKVFTRLQLRTARDEGTIDDDQLEEIWATQNREQTRREIREDQDARDKKRDTESFVDTEFSRYLNARPDVRKVGSADHTKVKEEYSFLVDKMGEPDSKDTELKAMRAAFGASPERIPERTAARRETPGDASGSAGTGGDRPVDIWNRVPKHLKAYYQKQVADGFKTMDDVKKDIPYMESRPH